MNRFNYKAKDKNGRLVMGEVEASDVTYAAKLIRGKGLFVISISPIGFSPLAFIRGYKDRIRSSEIATLTRQLATMINAGLPITEALIIMRAQTKGPLQKVIAQILADVEAGESFSNALSRHGKLFPPSYIALVRAGEVGGVMDSVLTRLADTLEKQQEFRAKVRGAMIYPTIIIVGMIVVTFIMMIFVVPRLTSLYGDFNAVLPLPTRILIGVSNFFIHFWWLMIFLAGAGGYFLKLFKETKEGRRKIDELIFKIPIFGDLQRQIILTELTRTLALMVGSGVPILEALNVTAGVVSNTVISDALRDSAKQVERGFPIAYSFAKHPEAFPFILSQMVAVGEETGKIDDVLVKISHIFEVESDEKVKGLTASIEPLVMVVLGLGVGFLVIAVILPIYNLTNQF